MSELSYLANISFIDMPAGDDLEDGWIGPCSFDSLSGALDRGLRYVGPRVGVCDHADLDNDEKIRILVAYFMAQSQDPEERVAALDIRAPSFSLQCGDMKVLAEMLSPKSQGLNGSP